MGSTVLKSKSENIKAVILAGGLGTRLRPYTLVLPKPLLPVGTKPILEHIVEWLKESEITQIVVSTGYLGRLIEEYFGDGARLGVEIEYVNSGGPMGIAGQLRSAKGSLGETFVCVYGDAILDFKLDGLIKFHQEKKALLTMALLRHETWLKYGVIRTKDDGRVSEWREKPAVVSEINVGCYVMDRGFFRYIPNRKVYGMKEAFDAAVARKERIYALRMEGTFLDIGDKAAYREANDYYLKKYGKVP